MDPNACVKRILSGLAGGDEQDALDGCADLYRWCERGGFRPCGWNESELGAFLYMATRAARKAGAKLRAGSPL